MAASDCGACGEHFTGLSAFDRHQTTAYGTAKPVTCHAPGERGLVRQRFGRWGFPASAASRAWVASLRAEQGHPGISGTPGTPRPADFDSGMPEVPCA